MRLINTALFLSVLALAACHTPKGGSDGSSGSSAKARRGRMIHESATGLSFDDRLKDANGNGVDDASDISSGRSKDLNRNGIPDEAEEF